MRNIFCIIVFVLLAVPLFAQNFAIKGSVVDSLTHQPLAFSNIVATSVENASLVYGALSNLQGDFEITGLKKGNYYLQIKFAGYTTKLVENIIAIKFKKSNI